MITLQHIHPELREAYEQFPIINIWDDLQKVREAMKVGLQELERPPVPGVAAKDVTAQDTRNTVEVPVRVYTPETSDSCKLPALLWIHGGGYVLGSMEGDDFTARNFAKEVGCIVVSVDYRLAPEHPFPAPLEDCYSALLWLFNSADSLGVDSQRIAIGGISAGGGLTSALALLARDRAEVTPLFQLLLCPMLDDSSTTPSSYSITEPSIWNRESNLRGWEAYLNGNEDSLYAAAARASNLEGLPPAYIAVGSADLFVDENIEYAQRLIRQGVQTELVVYPGGFHSFEYFAPNASISRRARESHYGALKRAFAL